METKLIYSLPDKFLEKQQLKTVEVPFKTESIIQEKFQLWAHPYNTEAKGDITSLEFFGFWDPDTKTIVSRIKAGFQVFTPSTNPASIAITTRPIASHPESDVNLSLLTS